MCPIYGHINQDFPAKLKRGVDLENVLCMPMLSEPFYI